MDGESHSSVDSSAPTILWSRVQNTSTPSTLLYIVKFCTIFAIVLRRGRNKQKEAVFGPYFKILGKGGVVSLLTLYADKLSSSPAFKAIHSFFCKFLSGKRKLNEERCRGWPTFKQKLKQIDYSRCDKKMLC